MSLSPRDVERLKGVNAGLVSVVRRASQMWAARNTGYRFQVSEGVRTIERQKELFAKGRTTPGPKVTWTMESRHITGHAVDIVLVKDGKLAGDKDPAWEDLSDCMFDAAKELKTTLRWGGDFDQDGIAREKGEGDLVHFELPRAQYP